MPTSRETFLTSVHARVSALPATALLGDVLPESVPAEGLLILRDGDPSEPDVTLLPLAHHYQHRAAVETVVQGPARKGVFDTLTGSSGTALSTERTLGGLCDLAQAKALIPVDLSIDGAANLKCAAIPVVLHYPVAYQLAYSAGFAPY